MYRANIGATTQRGRNMRVARWTQTCRRVLEQDEWSLEARAEGEGGGQTLIGVVMIGTDPGTKSTRYNVFFSHYF